MNLRRTFFIIGIVLLGLLGVLIINPPGTEAAFGTSPPWVKNNHMLPGTTFEQVINLSRNTAEQDMEVGVTISGDKDLVKWITIENQDNLIMKKGQKILPMKVRVESSKRAALKNYKGDIYAVLRPIVDKNNGGGTLSIKVGAHILVDINVVGTKVTDYNIKAAAFDILNEGDPFIFNLFIDNIGNTDINSLKGTVDIFNKNDKEPLKTLTLGDLQNPIAPDESVKAPLEFNEVKLPAGDYWASIKIYKGEELIFNKRFLQKIVALPVAKAEEVVERKGPSIPKLTTDEENVDSKADLVTNDQSSLLNPNLISLAFLDQYKIFILFGLIGLAIGFLTLVFMIFFLIKFIKSQQKIITHEYEHEHSHEYSAPVSPVLNTNQNLVNNKPGIPNDQATNSFQGPASLPGSNQNL